jgi:hypothetical protein
MGMGPWIREPGADMARAPRNDEIGLGRASGVNRVVVADIKAGRRGGSVRSLKALAAALGVGIDDLV